MPDWLAPVATIITSCGGIVAGLTWFIGARFGHLKTLILENRRKSEELMNSHRSQIQEAIHAVHLRLQRIEIEVGLNGIRANNREVSNQR
jgi:hypothetical protein